MMMPQYLQSERIRRIARYTAALKALALEGDKDAEIFIRDNSPTGDVRRHTFIKAAMGDGTVKWPSLTERVRTRVVVEALEK